MALSPSQIDYSYNRPFQTEPTLRPRRKSARANRDLWGKLKKMLAGRIQDRYGLSADDAEVQAERWMRLSAHEHFAEISTSKVVPIR